MVRRATAYSSWDSAGHYTVLYTFSGADGQLPNGYLVRDAVGSLYGTTRSGGTYGKGTVFKFSNLGLQTLYNFQNVSGPTSLIRDAQGFLYGATFEGGVLGCENTCGTVFKVSQTGVFTVLYTFTGGLDGGNPTGALVQDAAGNLYGTSTAEADGNVFKLSGGKLTVLHTFKGGSGDGSLPQDLILDSSGNLYGLTQQGGPCCGVLFKIIP